MLKSSEWYERGLDHSVLVLALMTASVISWLLISELAWADWNSSQPPLGSKLKLLSNDEVVMLFDYLPDGMYLYEPESGQSIYEDKIGQIDQNDILDIAASNLDDDEWDEIAVVDNKGGIGENDAVWILDTGDGISWSWHGPHGISSPFIKDVACGDINGDGMDDIVFLDNGGGTGSDHRDALWWYKWGGASNDVLYYEGYYSSFWDYIKDIDCGDIDGDGYEEAVGIDVGGGSYDEIRIYDFNEAATYSIQPEQKGWVDMTCGNFDTNLITDEIVVLDSNGDNKDALWFYALNSDKTVKDFYHIYTDYNNLSSVASGDVNNDGHDDVVMLDNEGDNLDVIRFISLVMYDITIELIEPPPSFTARNSMGFDIACGDFDGDSPTTVFAQGYGPIDREDPNEVIAVLYAPPYERGMSEGTYDSQIGFEHSDTEGYSDALSVSMETTIGLSAGVETPFGGFKASVSASIDAGIEQTVGQQRTVTIGDVYSIADNPVDGVVVATTKYWAYFYQIVDPNNKLGTNSDGEYFVISVPQPKSMQSAPTIWTLEEAYNARARENGRPTIPSAHMVGDMRSYPNSLQYPDGGGMQGADVWISENLSPNKGTGPAVKKVSVDTMEFQETTLSAGVTLTAGFEVQGPGGSVGVSFERSTRVGVSATHMTAVGNSTTFCSSRGYIPADLYDTYSCTYKMFTYRHPDGYWVIDYYLTGLNWGHYLPVVIFPDGGENEILKGDTTITWKRPARYKQDNFSQINEVSIYEVYYSEDGGSNWTLIHTITDPATTSYAWNTASVPDDDNYKIKVKTTFDDGTTTADSSDNTFKINNVGPWAEIDVSGDNVLKEGGIIYISDEDIQRMMSITQEQWMALKAMGSPCTVTLNLINVTDSTTIEQVRFRQSVNGVIGPWQEFSYPGVSNVSTTSQDGTKWIEGQLQEKPEYGGEWWDIPDITIVQDTEPPELISFAVVDEDGDGYTQDTSVKLIIESYTDATSGINRMRFRHDMGPWEEHVYPQEFGLFESEEKDSINFPWTLSGANEGQRTISIQIVDKVGGGGRDDTPLKTATIFYDKNPPSAPTNLSASPTQEKITLTWNASSDPAPSSGMKMYNVYRSAWSPVQTNEDNLIAQVEENKYEDTDFIHHPGGGGLVVFNYYYVVTAVDMADNESDTSNTAIASISGTIINAKQLRALQLDGKKSDDDEYSYTDIAGALFRATFYPYYQAYNLYVRAAEDGEDLYLAFDIPDNTQNNNDYAAVLIDVDRDRSSQPQTDDLWLQIKRGADVGNEVSGTGSGWSGFRSPNEWDARSVDGPESWSAEFKIEYGKLDVQAWQTDTLGICFMAYDADATKWVLWPTGADKSKPNTWGKIYSSNLWRGDILNVSRGDLYDDVCYRGQKDAGVLPLELKIIDETQSTSNETIINSITLQRRGSSTDSDIAKVRLWDDRSTLGKVNSGDSLVAEGDLSSGWITFTNINYSVTWDTVSHLLASYEIDSNAALGHTVGAELTSVIVASPDRVTVRRSLTPGTTIEEPIISDSVRIVNAAPGFFGKNVESFAIVAGDLMLDGDTLADLVIGDVDSTRIYLSSNGFQFPLSLPDGVSRSLALADVDNDGNVDLVCGKEGEIALFIDPVFEFDGAATSLALGDLDHDGDPEVVVGTENGSFVLKNEGGTSFTLWQELNGGYTNDVALGDLDGDGDLDIVDGIWGVGSKLYFNNGLGDLQLVDTVGAPEVSDVELMDIDSDGDLDLAVAYRHRLAGLAVYENDGGDFTELQTLDIISGGSDFSHPVTLTSGDIEHDGDVDLILGEAEPSYEIHPLLMCINSGGYLEPRWRYLCCGVGDMAQVDIDVDGDLDLAIASTIDLWGACSDWLYLNVEVDTNENVNLAPSPPSGLSFSQDYGGVTFSWNAASDEVCSSNLLTYNLRVVGPEDTVLSGDIPVGPGNVRHSLSHLLRNLPGGQYRWQVQSVDPGYARSAWSEESVMTLHHTLTASGEDRAPTSVDQGQQETEMEMLTLEAKSGSGVVNSLTAERTGTGADADISQVSLVLDNGNGEYGPEDEIIDQKSFSSGIVNFSFTVTVSEGQPKSLFVLYSFSETAEAGKTFGAKVSEITVANPNFFDPSNLPLESSLCVVNQFADAGVELGNATTHDVVIGDIDGDGDLDLVAGNIGPNAVYENDGTGTLTKAQGLGSGATYALAMGDIDNDGDLDIVAGNFDEPDSVYLNDGSGAFTNSGQSLDSSKTVDVVLADVDNDGDLDLVVGNGQFQEDKVYMNDGTGTFEASDQSLGSYKTRCMTSGDVDVDGDRDVVIGTEGQGIKIYLNDALGGFSGPIQSLGSDYVYGVILRDVDGDSDLDLIAANVGENKVYQNDNAGYFSDTGQNLGSSHSTGVASADMDNDGDLDLIFSNLGAGEFYINDGAGGFALAQSLGSQNGYSAAIGDLDNDGNLDVIAGNVGANRVYENMRIDDPNQAPSMPTALSSQMGGGGITLTWSGATDSETPQNVLSYNVRIGTTSGDHDAFSGIIPAGPGNVGHTLSYTIKNLPQDTYYWSVQTIDGGFKRSAWATEKIFSLQMFEVSDQDIGAYDTYTLVLGDVDNDGDFDLVEGNGGGQGNRVYLNDGDGAFTDSGQNLGASDTRTAALVDVDNDGDLDLVTGNAQNQGNRVYLNNGAGIFTDSGQSLGSHNTQAVVLGDLDYDGDLDLATGNDGQANRVYLNDGTGIFTDSGQSLGSYQTTSLALGDVDADGDLDLVEGNDSGETNRVYLNDGTGTFTDSQQTLGTYLTQSIVLGDVDGDGDLDLVAGNSDGQANRVYLNDGNGEFTDSEQSIGSYQTYSVALADVDNDGDWDLVEGNADLSKIYLNDGDGHFTDSGWNVGLSDTRLVSVGDVDSDGDVDMVEGKAQPNKVHFNNVAELVKPNEQPSSPVQLIADVSDSVVILFWGFGSDDETPNSLLTYNLRVGTASGGNQIFSGIIPVGSGNMGHTNVHTIKGLSPGTYYYWSVQTIDNGFARSDWAAERVFAAGMVKGDVNSDGSINVLDLVRAVNIILGIPPEPTEYELWAADCNENGTVNVLDVIGIVNVILGLGTCPPTVGTAKVSFPTARVWSPRMSGERRAKSGELPIWVDSQTDIAGAQLTLSYDPAVLTPGELQLTPRCDGMILASNTMDGDLTIVVYSIHGEAIQAGIGPILAVSFEVVDIGLRTLDFALEFSEVILVGEGCQAIPVEIEPIAMKTVPLPTEFALEQNYPNPFNPTTTIRYAIPSREQRAWSREQRAESREVRGMNPGLGTLRSTLKIYNILGQEVRTLVDENKEAGYYTVTWDGKDSRGLDVASGIYFYRLMAGQFTNTKRMVLLK